MIHVSPQHRMLGVPAIDAVKVQFPQARIVPFDGGPCALIPHSFIETRLLRGMGFEVPAPVLSQYEFPHPAGQPPFEVQRKTVAMMTTNQRGYNLNGMGTGKTRCALWAYDYLRKAGLANKCLIVAPLSTLDFTWKSEVFRLPLGLSATVLHGDKRKRQKRLAEDHDIYIINPDGLEVLFNDLIVRTDIDTMVIDELAVFRNPSAKKTKVAADLAKRMVWAWGMTGSPTPEEPTDAYGQCKVLTPHTVPTRFSHFRDATMARIGQFKYVPKNDAKDTVFRVMQPAVRYTLDDVVELPELIERTVDVPMGVAQQKAYEELRIHALTTVGSSEVTAANAGAVLIKLLQVSLGYIYVQPDGDEAREIHTLDNTARLDRLVEDIRECNNKVIVFAPFTHAIQGISDRLTQEKITHAVVQGSTPQRERPLIFNLFQNTDNPKVLLAHPNCMAHGITLTRADTIIWFGPIASLETFEQANARIRRVGQKLKQLVLMYQGTKVEKAMYSALRGKQKIQDSVLALFANAQI